MKRQNQARGMRMDSFSAAITIPIMDPVANEQVIISLNDKFLTNGMHFIKVKDVEHGRSLMQTFLTSLNYYHEVAALSTNDQPLDNSVINLFKVLDEGGWLRYPYNDFCEYLCDHFYSDFLWIEATHDLLSADWYKNFEHHLIDLHFDKSMPIMLISYDNNS